MTQPAVDNLELETLRAGAATGSKPLLPPDIDLIRHVQVSLTAVVGSAEIPVERLFALRDGDVLPLKELVNEPVTLCIENRPVARGLLVAVEDHFGVEITEILSR